MSEEPTPPDGRPPRIWLRFRRLDIVGAIGAALLVPQVVDRFVNGTASDPTLAGLGALLVVVAGGGPRVADAVARRWGGAR